MTYTIRATHSLILTLYTLWITPMVVLAQDSVGGTVRGRIVDPSKAQLPIAGVLVVIVNVVNELEYETSTDSHGEYRKPHLPPGRYLVNFYKEGYGDRIGKLVTVIDGGDHYVPLKMTRKVGLIDDLLQRKFDFLFWLLLLCFAFVLGFITGRRTDHQSN